MSFEDIARRAQAAFEPYVVMMFLSPEIHARYKALGLRGRQGYFLQRAAPMGQVPAEVVTATFYNFNPTLVASGINTGWQLITPEAIWRECLEACTEALSRLLPPAEGEDEVMGNIEKALPLVKQASEGLSPAGRALFGGCQSIPWPDAPMQALWHGLNLLREYRGDGHIIALMSESIAPLECLLLQAAYSTRLPLQFLLTSRAWSEEVKAAQENLAKRDLLVDGALTDKGREQRERVEQLTDRLDTAPFEKLGEAASEELISLVGALSRRIVKHGGIQR